MVQLSKSGIKEIAALAGVSPATVSRVLHTPEIVSDKTLGKVKRIIDRVGYRPNRFGASLRTRKSFNIVAIIPDITKPVNAKIIRGIETEAQCNGYSVLLGDTQGLADRERHYADMVKYGQADGILLFSSRLPFDIEQAIPLSEQLPPIVNACERVDSPELIQVSINNSEAAKQAVEHLLSLGHKRIAAITGPLDTPSTGERLAGYQRALKRAGIRMEPSLVLPGDYSIESGAKMTEKLLLRRERPTAIFCFSDDMAIGAMKVLHKHGFHIPKDMSVMGFDDIRYARFVAPSLTTVRQPLEEIGRCCVQQLCLLLSGKRPKEHYTELPFTLKIRESTGASPEVPNR